MQYINCIIYIKHSCNVTDSFSTFSNHIDNAVYYSTAEWSTTVL